jgi:DNA-binding XRE family transcriptional regulator
MTQLELADAAHVDLKTIYNLESGTRWPIARTRAAISAALRWETDALGVIAAGAEPVEVPPGRAVAPELPPDRILPALAVTDEDALAPYKQQVAAELAKAAEEYGLGFTGAQAFGAGTLAALWWDADPNPLTPDEVARLIAVTRKLSAERGGGQDRRTGLAPPG